MLEIVKMESQQETLTELIDRAGVIHAEIAQKTLELRDLKTVIAKMASYKEGSKTGHIDGELFSATVQLKENVTWDQNKLEALRVLMGEEEFFKVFQWKFEPKSKKILDGALEFGQFGNQIREAFTVSPGSPQLSFKKLESC
jgi:hypothetical protein